MIRSGRGRYAELGKELSAPGLDPAESERLMAEMARVQDGIDAANGCGPRGIRM